MDELIDRYGDPPRTVNNLISVALLRADAARNGISQIDQKGANLNFYLDQFDLQRVSACAAWRSTAPACSSPPGSGPIWPCG